MSNPLHPVRRLRQERGLSLTQLTMLTGISTGDLSQLERGLRPAFPGWRKRLAAAFGVSEEALFPPKAA